MICNKLVLKIILALFMLLISACGIFIIPTTAAENIYGSLIIDCESANIKLYNMEWNIYKAAEITESSSLKLTGDFSEYPVKLDLNNESTIISAAYTLQTYTVADSIKPIYSDTAGSEKRVAFNCLEEGIYLVTATPFVMEETMMSTTPMLIAIADGNKYNQNWSLNMTVIPKIGIVGSGDINNYTDRTVKKVWIMSDPVSDITVELFRNGEHYDTVILNSENNWEYTWKNLPDSYHWIVVEKNPPDNFYVDYMRKYQVNEDDKTELLIINNTYEPQNPQITTTTDINEISKTSITTEVAINEALPNTGQPWLPVVLFGFSGILIFLLGLYIYKFKK